MCTRRHLGLNHLLQKIIALTHYTNQCKCRFSISVEIFNNSSPLKICFSKMQPTKLLFGLRQRAVDFTSFMLLFAP